MRVGDAIVVVVTAPLTETSAPTGMSAVLKWGLTSVVKETAIPIQCLKKPAPFYASAIATHGRDDGRKTCTCSFHYSTARVAGFKYTLLRGSKRGRFVYANSRQTNPTSKRLE
ncbi:hypothetical protein EJB05_54644 [Eragrostis curvula]|uniref:Uncharacterized protein n=1 Tax=Eragrostis curvula TaxID=38414 RepID=A0A5J9SLU2_9POAL|nr:hypothetical protein EJB05_54644 [Eragrostis curvula]